MLTSLLNRFNVITRRPWTIWIATPFGLAMTAAITILAFSITPLHAGELEKIQNRVSQLEQALKSLQTSDTTRGASVASAVAITEQLKIDFLKLQGDIDANRHKVDEAVIAMDRQQGEMENRLRMMEERFDIYEQQMRKALAKISPNIGSETDAYQGALTKIKSRDYLNAVADLQAFIKKYPKSDLKENALFWVGESYYAMRDYQKAIKSYQIVTDSYPKSEKIPAVLLKQGLSFFGLQMEEEGKLFLSKVVSAYPQTPEALQAQKQLDELAQKATVPTSQQNPADVPLAPGVGTSSTPKSTSPVKNSSSSTADRY